MTEDRSIGALTEPEIIVLPDPEACAAEAAERIVASLTAAATERLRAHWVTTGGSAPGAIYRRLAVEPLRPTVPWDRVQLWFTDERFVGLDHPLSNAKIAFDLLLHTDAIAGTSGSGGGLIDVLDHETFGAPIPAANVHPFPVGEAIGEGRDAAWCAARAVEMLRTSDVPVNDGWPVFDLVLLGVGADGHLLSVFPGSATFDESDWVLAVPAPTHIEPHVERITLNPRILDAARELLVVATGEGKVDALRGIFGPDRDPRLLPAQLARRSGATWILDAAAAAALAPR